MNNAELIDELIKLGNQCHKVARLINALPNIVSSSLPAQEIRAIHVKTDIDEWPQTMVDNSRLDLNINYLKILQYHAGKGKVYTEIDSHILSDTFEYSDNLKIYRKKSELRSNYDLILIHESLEFTASPQEILTSLVPLLNNNGKLWIKFRPWTSNNGGFQSTYYDKAYAHLTESLSCNDYVRFRVNKPISTYEAIIQQLNLKTINRNIISNHIPQFFLDNKNILDAIINNSMGPIDRETGMKILMTSSIEYLLSI